MIMKNPALVALVTLSPVQAFAACQEQERAVVVEAPFDTPRPYPTYTPLTTPSSTDADGERQVMRPRLETVRDRGAVICASRNDAPGWGYLDAAGNNVGFDIDLCRAVATAVLGDPSAIEIPLITAAERGPTIRSSEVDMMVRTVTWTTSRDAVWGNFAHTMFTMARASW